MMRIPKLRDEHISPQTISELPGRSLKLFTCKASPKRGKKGKESPSKSQQSLSAEDESKELTQSREGVRVTSVQAAIQLEMPDRSIWMEKLKMQRGMRRANCMDKWWDMERKQDAWL
jgi:hypothetical protein